MGGAAEAGVTEVIGPLDPRVLPAGVRSRFLDNINGLRVHILEAGYATSGRPCVLLLHGFPELAYSWRNVMPALAAAGFHAVAPDLRGYGRTTGWDGAYDSDLRGFRLLNAVRDALGVVWALGYRATAGVVGHDFGSPVAAWCALVRPDVFRTVTLMSAPFGGAPALPGATRAEEDIHPAMAALDRPRKHYQWYYSTRPANEDMWHCSQGVHDFLRAYYHHKSADWKANRPFRLGGWTAGELAKMPTYYIMDLHETMPQTVAHEMPSAEEIAACRWLPDDELAVYAGEYTRNGFQGGLQWYRRGTGGLDTAELETFAGRTIDVPAMFVAGNSDWGTYQVPGMFERMQERACARMEQCHLIEGAGHWVQQEQAEKVGELLVGFLRQ
ncbi:MAG TPA: alpha/beta hydrolase [Acetobacteraceae bacterium]|nr:alpha/beta hydrolase [Acetobacteraceae bacterium]